jgi:hypothetical protein
LTKIAKKGRFPECEEEIGNANKDLKRLEVVHRRVSNRLKKLYMSMGMDPNDQEVGLTHVAALLEHLFYVL